MAELAEVVLALRRASVDTGHADADHALEPSAVAELLGRSADLAERLLDEVAEVPATRLRPSAREVSATEAKNEFAALLETAVRRGPVVIRKHEEPRAVLVSWAEYDALVAPHRRLERLTAAYDARVAAMQRPAARAAMRAAFDASPEELGAAAVAAARRDH